MTRTLKNTIATFEDDILAVEPSSHEGFTNGISQDSWEYMNSFSTQEFVSKNNMPFQDDSFSVWN